MWLSDLTTTNTIKNDISVFLGKGNYYRWEFNTFLTLDISAWFGKQIFKMSLVKFYSTKSRHWITSTKTYSVSDFENNDDLLEYWTNFVGNNRDLKY